MTEGKVICTVSYYNLPLEVFEFINGREMGNVNVNKWLKSCWPFLRVRPYAFLSFDQSGNFLIYSRLYPL